MIFIFDNGHHCSFVFVPFQYTDNFNCCLMDARLLDNLTKRELEKQLGITRKAHQSSIVQGITFLRMIKYDRQVFFTPIQFSLVSFNDFLSLCCFPLSLLLLALVLAQAIEDRRKQCEATDCDPLVWTNQRFITWAKSIDLAEYANNLRGISERSSLPTPITYSLNSDIVSQPVIISVIDSLNQLCNQLNNKSSIRLTC